LGMRGSNAYAIGAKVFWFFFSKKNCLLFCLVLSGCSRPACLLPSQQPMAMIDMYFGRGYVSDTAWADFLARSVTPRFTAGFTVIDAFGQWQAPSGQVVREPSKLLRVAAPLAPDLAARVQAVVDAYKVQFRQASVGIVTTTVCASF
jgi:hypothetical protein